MTSLRVWMRQVQRDGGERPGPPSAEIARIKELERENRELRQANEILRKGEPLTAIGPRTMASAYFAQAPLTVCRQTVAGQRNRTIKDATAKRYHDDDHAQMRTHLADFLAADNFARRLETLSGLTPYEYICRIWTSEPDRFIFDLIHQMPGLNS